MADELYGLCKENRKNLNYDIFQRDAVSMALSHRLSIVLGGAGCGDKVLITKNDSRRGCWNGDIGTLIIAAGDEATEDPDEYQYGIILDRNRFPKWHGADSLDNLELAYAITVHKAQGSEFDDVLMPMTMDSSRMLYRNLLYTAASRARRRVTIYGSRNAVDVALRSFPPRRRSMLVAKTRMRMERRI